MSSDARGTRASVIHELLSELRTLSDRDVQLSQAMADRLGVHLTDLRALGFLHSQTEPITAGKLTEYTGLTSGAVTAIVDRLEKAGYVRRTKSPSDRRVVVLEPLPEQMKALVDLHARLGANLALVWSKFSAAELSTALDFVRRVSTVMDEAAQQLRPARPKEAMIGDGRASAPLGEVKRGTLRFASGAAVVRLRGGAADDELFHATFDGRMPTVRVDEGNVTVQYARFNPFDWRKAGATVALSEAIPWHIDLRGGASQVDADLSKVELAGFELTGGVSHVEARLPKPKGVVTIRVSGGASHVTLRRPAKTAARVVLTGGASSLQLDDQQFGSVGGLVRLMTPGAQEAKDVFDVEVSGGVSHVEVLAG